MIELWHNEINWDRQVVHKGINQVRPTVNATRATVIKDIITVKNSSLLDDDSTVF